MSTLFLYGVRAGKGQARIVIFVVATNNESMDRRVGFTSRVLWNPGAKDKKFLLARMQKGKKNPTKLV